MPYRLTDLVLDRIDLVTEPCNEFAKVMIWKALEPHEETKPLPIPNALRGLMAGKYEGNKLYIEDRRSLDEWRDALPRGVCLGETPAGSARSGVGRSRRSRVSPTTPCFG